MKNINKVFLTSKKLFKLSNNPNLFRIINNKFNNKIYKNPFLKIQKKVKVKDG